MMLSRTKKTHIPSAGDKHLYPCEFGNDTREQVRCFKKGVNDVDAFRSDEFSERARGNKPLYRVTPYEGYDVNWDRQPVPDLGMNILTESHYAASEARRMCLDHADHRSLAPTQNRQLVDNV